MSPKFASPTQKKSQPFCPPGVLLTFGGFGPRPQQERHKGRRHLLQLRVGGAREEQGLDDDGAELLGEPAQQLLHDHRGVPRLRRLRALLAPPATAATAPAAAAAHEAAIAAAARLTASRGRRRQEEQGEGQQVPLHRAAVSAARAGHQALHGLEEAGPKDARHEAAAHHPGAGWRGLAEAAEEDEEVDTQQEEAGGSSGGHRVPAARGRQGRRELRRDELEEGEEGAGEGRVRGRRRQGSLALARVARAAAAPRAAAGGPVGAVGEEEEGAEVPQALLGDEQRRD